MPRVTDKKVLKAIRLDIAESKHLSYAQIARNHGVSYNVVNLLVRLVFKQLKEKELHGAKCVIGGKTEAYYTEEEMLAPLPTYTAIHRDKITPIRKDWQLITYED
jgi:hypothetical protein